MCASGYVEYEIQFKSNCMNMKNNKMARMNELMVLKR